MGSMEDRQLTPADQGNDGAPLGWKPTMQKPLPVSRCTAMKKDGNRCNRWSLRGTTICYVHGGRLPNVQSHAEAMVEAARLRLVDYSDGAIDTIYRLATDATAPENVQLKASTEILDRIGVRGGFEVDVEQTITVNPADEVRKRLATLARREAPEDEPVLVELEAIDETEIHDAEVVDEHGPVPGHGVEGL